MPQIRPVSAGYLDAILKAVGIDPWFLRNRLVQLVRIGSMYHMTKNWLYHTRIVVFPFIVSTVHAMTDIFCKFVLGAVSSVVFFSG
jgi:hypothetical protein